MGTPIRKSNPLAGVRSAAFLATFFVACAGATDFEVRSPVIDVREFEYDLKVAHGFDRRPANAHGRGIVNEFEFGVSDWWSPAIEGEWGRQAGPNEPAVFQGLTFENRFQLTKRGEHWLDHDAMSNSNPFDEKPCVRPRLRFVVGSLLPFSRIPFGFDGP